MEGTLEGDDELDRGWGWVGLVGGVLGRVGHQLPTRGVARAVTSSCGMGSLDRLEEKRRLKLSTQLMKS